MKVLICGSRKITGPYGYNLVEEAVRLSGFEVTGIISGGAGGVDTLAKIYAKKNNIPYYEYLPEWNMYGKSAGFKRNTTMVIEADATIAVWDGISKGTAHSIAETKKRSKPLYVVNVVLPPQKSKV